MLNEEGVNTEDLHVLSSLRMPDRYEALEALVGPKVAELLVAPPESTLSAFRKIGRFCRTKSQGQFAPIVGASGVGKTTLSRGLRTFLPQEYTSTCRHTSSVKTQDLKDTVAKHLKELDTNDSKVIPVLIDDREATPPTASELAAIKGFLRDPKTGARCIVVWPDTSHDTAQAIAEDYTSAAGNSIINLPIEVEGPDRSVWQQIAKHTLESVNSLERLSDLGVDPDSYDPGKYPSLGSFLGKISADFVTAVDKHLHSLQKKVTLAVVFASETSDAGILSQLCSPTRYGLIDGNALLSASPSSDIGDWWRSRRGLLTQTLLRLNARAYSLPPSTSVAVLRRYGADEVQKCLANKGRNSISPAQVNERLASSDIGRYLTGRVAATREARGNPANDAKKQYNAVSQVGFTGGRDKRCNQSVKEAVEFLLKSNDADLVAIECEKQLSFADLIPDLHIEKPEDVICIELTWRTGDWLQSNNRSNAAMYIMTKLRNYAAALGWD